MTTINAINNLEEGAIKSVVKEGYTEIIILKNSLIVTKLLKNMINCLKSVEKNYPKNIKVKEE